MECLDCQFAALGLADMVDDDDDDDEKLTHIVSGRAGNFIIYNQIFVYTKFMQWSGPSRRAHVFYAAIVNRHIASAQHTKYSYVIHRAYALSLLIYNV